MSEPEDPPRWLESSSAPPGLKAALGAARGDLGSDAQVARLAERLGPLLEGGAAPGAGAGAGAASAGTKLGVLALSMLAVGGAAYLLGSQPASRAVPAVPARAPAPAPSAEQPARSSLPAALPSTEPEVPAPSASAPPAESSRAAPVASSAPSEAELLEQARAALKTNPSRALQRVNEHARRFPRGVLVQEREVLAIQALRQLGRDAEAERRAEAFARAFPGSAFRPKLK